MTRALKAVLVHSAAVGCCPAMLESTPSIGESGPVVDAESVDPGQNDLEETLAAHRRRVREINARPSREDGRRNCDKCRSGEGDRNADK